MIPASSCDKINKYMRAVCVDIYAWWSAMRN